MFWTVRRRGCILSLASAMKLLGGAMRGIVRTATAVIAVGLLSACALSEDKVPVDYIPNIGVTPVAGAQAVSLTVTGVDRRTQYTDRISTKKNGYGMEMARIIATNDVVEVVRSGVERELKAQGYAIGPSGLSVTVELQNFYNNFRVGLMAGGAVADVAIALKVRNAAGTLIYSQLYDASTTNDVFMASGTNAKASLEKALTMTTMKIVEDKALQAALLSARPAAPARAGGARS
jgi:uncharacterized lipoprotein YajG